MPNMSKDTSSAVEGRDSPGTETEEQEEYSEEEGVAEDELSVELQQLLEGKTEHWLEADNPSLGRIIVKDDRNHIEINSWLFDIADNSDKFFKEWRMLLGAQARVRLLQAIGNCRTLREIDMRGLARNEMAALLTPLQSNPVLNGIAITSYSSAFQPTGATERDEHTERICEILGRILQTSGTLKSLIFFSSELTAAGVYHLASGLRRNPESALDFLNLSIGESVERSVLKQVAEMVLSAPRLSKLSLGDVGVLDDDGIDAWVNTLSQSTSLKTLMLGNVRRGATALLLKAFTGEASNRSITFLGLYGVMEGVGDCLPLLLSSNQSLKDLEWNPRNEAPSPKQWRSLVQSLSSSSSLELFRILVPLSSFGGEAIDDVDALFSTVDMQKACVGLYLNSSSVNSPWFSKSEWRDDEEAEELLLEVMKKPILELHLGQLGLSDITTVWAKLAKALSSKVSPFSSLYLQMRPVLRSTEGRKLEDFFHALRDSSTLRLLTIEGGNGEYWPGGWKKLVDCLHVNTSITHLRLIDCNDLEDDVFMQFMEVLQVNLTLKRVRLSGSSWETDGKKALIEEALRRNAEQDSYFSVFRRHNLPFHPAKSGRVFLCGSPFAGKTRLRHTMTRAFSGSRWLGEKAAQLRRTEGIEVELLKNDEDMQIAVWDLAGQWIFRTLQDILFPRTTHASIFLFVFSPYDRRSKCIREDLDHCFQSELEEWLRFIASNSQVTGRMLPKVVVVISHMDKLKDRDSSWAQNILTTLREEYENILDIRSERLYIVDVRRKSQVGPLKHFIFEIFRQLLSYNTPLAPRVCTHISSVLAKRTKDIKYRPVWSSREFYRFCLSSLQEYIEEPLRLDTTSGLEVFEAIASCLQDTGSVIIIRSLDRIIVDPNWLTNFFLGEMITMGHNFEVRESAVQTQRRVRFSSRTGFVSSSDLQFLLSSFLEEHRKFRDLDKKFLEQLLVHFDLCYKVEDGRAPRYYIPTIVSEDANFTGMESLSWSSPAENDQEFVGFRVQCDNPRRMSMTAALYPRFQIHIRQKLMTEKNLSEEAVICSRNYMHIRIDGHEVFVERSDMAKSHIDVMVKCSKRKSREIALRYIEEHIVDELGTFCASTKGCPGVALVVGLLRTECVEKLVPLVCRGENQAILLTKLKENFESYIQEQLEATRPESWNKHDSSILNYEHSWPRIPDFLSDNSELAKDLLPKSEVENVTSNILEKREQRLKLLDQISEEMNKEIDQDQDDSAQKVVTAVGTSSTAAEVTNQASSSTSTISPSSSSMRRVLSEISHVRQDISHVRREMGEGFRSLEFTLRRIEENVNQIIIIQRQIQSSQSTFMSKIDRMIGYAESKERSKTPRRPYLSIKDLSIVHKGYAKMRLGAPVRLHLMCESMSGHHEIEDQPGLLLSLEKEEMEWLRCMYHISSRILYYVGKAALQMTFGLGEVVPGLDSVKAHLPVSVIASADIASADDDGMVSLERSGKMTLDEAWSRLRNTLAPHLKDNYTELFRLRKVKYLKLQEGGYAWVCDRCMSRDSRNKSLVCL